MMTRSLRMLLVVPVALAAACAGKDSSADAALQKDIALASQMSPYQPQQFVSPGEMGYNQYGQPMGYAPYPQPQYPGYYPQPAPQYQPAPVYQPVSRPAAARRTSTASRSTGTRSSGTVARREPVIVRNTKRDAAIGAAAGAVLGAATSRDKVKGAIIGGVAGGVLGGIIGHTVDVKRQ